MVHAGLVARGGLAALIPGKSGAGKSTTTLACLAAGFDFLSDDYVGVQEISDGSFVGHSLFATSVLEPNHLKRFPVFLPDAERTAHEHEVKSFLPLARRHGSQLAMDSPISLILIPHIVDAELTTFRRASKAAALMALAPPSLLSIPRPQVQTFEMLARLVERTPACWLELGRDIGSIPDVVADALQREAITPGGNRR
jgi:serine kinase of HPr protein (carbohydrate metabolism regulator)